MLTSLVTEVREYQDRSGSRVDTLAAPRTGVVFEGRVARVHKPGDALRYPWGEEHRDAAELARIAEQLPGKPVAVPKDKAYGHPTPVGPVSLIRSGVPHRVVGRIASARVDGEHVIAEFVIWDATTIKAIREDGVDELSLGYACRSDEQGYQRDTYVDHLAPVPRARCGETCALRRDAALEDGARTDCDGICTCQGNVDADLSAKQRSAVPATSFADPATRQEPIEDEAHVRAAMSRFGQTHYPSADERRTAFHRILGAAAKHGIDTSGFRKEWERRLDQGNIDGGTSCACRGLAESPGMDHATTMPDGTDLTKPLTDALAEVASLKARADQAEKDRDAQRARADQAEKDRDAAVAAKDAAELAKREAEKDAKAAQGRIDAAEEKATKAEADAKARTDAALDARVAARVEILKNAELVLGATDDKGIAIDRSKVSDLDLMKQVAQRVDGEDAILDTDGEPEVKVAYRGAMKRHAAASVSRVNVRAAVKQARQDGSAVAKRQSSVDAERAVMNRMNQDMATGWQR